MVERIKMTADVACVRMIRSKPKDFSIAVAAYKVIEISLDIDGQDGSRKLHGAHDGNSRRFTGSRRAEDSDISLAVGWD